jgi:hypothetical protein
VINPTYKHISDKLRFGDLTVAQLIALFCGLMGGLVFALYVSPFGPYLTLFVSIYVASVPVGAVLLATSTEFDLWLYVKACVGELMSDGRYMAGPGSDFTGYVIEPDELAGSLVGERDGGRTELGELWAL